MSDDRSKTGPADAKRVNVNQAHELRYWTQKFGCTEAQLKAAVKAVGPMVVDVKKKLGA